jgi:hypothetical protein
VGVGQEQQLLPFRSIGQTDPAGKSEIRVGHDTPDAELREFALGQSEELRERLIGKAGELESRHGGSLGKAP